MYGDKNVKSIIEILRKRLKKNSTDIMKIAKNPK